MSSIVKLSATERQALSRVISNEVSRKPEVDRRRIRQPKGGGASHNWWGRIRTCDPVTGLGTAVPIRGRWAADDPDEMLTTVPTLEGGEEIDVILGRYPPYRIGMFCHFIPSGPLVTPEWTANQGIIIAYQEPEDNELAPDTGRDAPWRLTCND